MKNILVIDSGSGGINIMLECIKKGASGNFLYYADTKNSPYGNKSSKELKKILISILEKVRPFFYFDIVLIACNTMTTSAIDYIRKKYKNIIFIGTEPAVKPARELFDEKDIVVMATNRTLLNLNIEGLCIENLPKEIDKNLFEIEKVRKLIEKPLLKYHDKKALVLGCTHFVCLKNIIKELLPDIKIFDSNEGVAKRLKLFCGEGDYTVQFISSDKDPSIFAEYFYQRLIESK